MHEVKYYFATHVHNDSKGGVFVLVPYFFAFKLGTVDGFAVEQ